MPELGSFAQQIFQRTYAFDPSETWEGCAARVAKFVANGDADLEARFFRAIRDRKFMPGGRYLYAAGRDIPQINNCYLIRARDSREGWADLIQKHMIALSTGGGVGTYYGDIRPKGTPIKRFGGQASGPISLMSMVNEVARHVMAGGKRRSALWAGLPWSHPDVDEFITAKNWALSVRALKEQDFNFPAPLDMTNISISLDDEFFRNVKKDDDVWDLYYRAVKRMLKTGEPGFSVNRGAQADQVCRNPCVRGSTQILTRGGYRRIDSLVGEPVEVWNGQAWSWVTPRVTGRDRRMLTVFLSDGTFLETTENHEWLVERGLRKNHRRSHVERVEAQDLQPGDRLTRFDMPVVDPPEAQNDPKWMYTYGFCCGDGFDYEGPRNRIGVVFPSTLPAKGWVPDTSWSATSRAAWFAGLLDADGTLVHNPNSAAIQLTSIDKSFLLRVRKMLTTLGVQGKVTPMDEGGLRDLPDGHGGKKEYLCQPTWRLLLSASDSWSLAQWLKPYCRRINVARCTQPQRDARRFARVESVKESGVAETVYCFNEPQLHAGTFEGIVTGQCCEVVSAEFDDVCNLGSVNLGAIETLEELEDITRLAVEFLYLGTFHGWMPHEAFAETRGRNRRIGLGIMGLHEWLLKQGLDYEPNGRLGRWLSTWQGVSDEQADKVAAKHNDVRPVAVRAIAPTGCQRPDTLVVTEDGILELQELGNPNGPQWQPLGLGVPQEWGVQTATRFYVNGEAETLRIELRSGVMLESTPNHQYRVLRDGSYVWERADRLRDGDLLVIPLGGYSKHKSPSLLPIPKHYRTERVVDFPTEVTPELSWFLGVYFADGSTHAKGIRIACNAGQPSTYTKVAGVGRHLFKTDPTFEDNGRGCMSVVFSSSMLLRWLFTNNLQKPLASEMEIPAVVRSFSRDCLEAFLSGYRFGDGSRTSQGVEYIDTCSYRMAQQLVVVWRALGRDANIYTNSAEGRWGGLMYRVRTIATRNRLHTKEVDRVLQSHGLGKCTVDAVSSITPSVSMTLDVEVPNRNTYIANSVVSHNTIGIIAETTTGIEPVFCTAYKRRWLGEDQKWQTTYVIDPTVERLVQEHGIDPDSVEDAMSLARNVERRIAMQAFIQDFVDQAISSTINLPEWGEPGNNNAKQFAKTLLQYLPRLRGITVYPDGARAGQPITPLKYETVKRYHREEAVYEESDERCQGGVCGI